MLGVEALHAFVALQCVMSFACSSPLRHASPALMMLCMPGSWCWAWHSLDDGTAAFQLRQLTCGACSIDWPRVNRPCLVRFGPIGLSLKWPLQERRHCGGAHVTRLCRLPLM